jgi:hypothetical protein
MDNRKYVITATVTFFAAAMLISLAMWAAILAFFAFGLSFLG